jgi:hypothetical protein
MYEGVAGVVQRTLADHAEALAWRTAENDVDVPIADAGILAYEGGANVGHAPADCGAVREIEFVGGAVDGIVFDGGGYVEPGLFEA